MDYYDNTSLKRRAELADETERRLNKKLEEGKLYGKPVPQIPVVLKSNRKKDGETQSFYTNCATGKRSFDFDEAAEGRQVKILSQTGRSERGFVFSYDDDLALLCYHVLSFDTHALKKGETRHWEEKYRLYIDSNKEVYSDVHAAYFGSYRGNKFIWHEDYSQIQQFFTRDMYEQQSAIVPLCASHDEKSLVDLEESEEKTMRPVHILFPSIVSGRKTRYWKLSTLYAFNEFLEYREPVRKNGPRQKKLDAFVSRGVKPKNEYVAEAGKAIRRWNEQWEQDTNKRIGPHEYSWLFASRTGTGCFTVAEKLSGSEAAVCIRVFIADPQNGNYHETLRLYFDSTGVTAGKITHKGDIISVPMYEDINAWDIPFPDIPEETAKETMLEFLSGILANVPEDKRGFFAWAFASFPLFEKMYKAGYKKTVKGICESATEWRITPRKLCEEMFGKLNDKKNLHAALGINKIQAEMLFADSKGYYSSGCDPKCGNKTNPLDGHQLLLAAKCIMTGTMLCQQNYLQYLVIPYGDKARKQISIAKMDNSRFQNVIKAMKEIYGLFDILEETLDIHKTEYMSNAQHERTNARLVINSAKLELFRGWSMATAAWGEEITCSERYCRQAVSLIREAVKKKAELMLARKVSDDCFASPANGESFVFGGMNTYADYADLCMKLNKIPGIHRLEPYFCDNDDLVRLHDNAVVIYNVQKHRIRDEKYHNSIGRVDRFVYANKEYMVVAPVTAGDFIREGQSLHHCVGIYLDRVIKGETNIMFIRKKDEPDVPFFTVEISDNGDIEQIHGLQNRNLDTEPDLIPFIEEWEKERGVRRNRINKVR